jgi:hypothetical protein
MLIAFIPVVLDGLPIVYEETLDILFQKSRGRFGVEAVYKKNLKSWEKTTEDVKVSKKRRTKNAIKTPTTFLSR